MFSYSALWKPKKRRRETLAQNSDKKVGTRSKLSPPSSYNVDNQEIFPLFVKKDATFSNID